MTGTLHSDRAALDPLARHHSHGFEQQRREEQPRGTAGVDE
ncbi:hypothetical protein [Phaeacidiphilus oryzae]|nr:hypothetical protein [Phaeacidiphilus oryzae]